MRRIALLAVSQCFGIIAFCQSPAATGRMPQLPPTARGSADSLFDPGAGSPPQASAATKPPGLSCGDRTPQSALPNVDQLFQLPCLSPRVFALTARIDVQSPPIPQRKGQRAKSIPIPTQWPDAKPIPIPTKWPNLKLLPLAGQNPAAIPAK